MSSSSRQISKSSQPTPSLSPFCGTHEPCDLRYSPVDDHLPCDDISTSSESRRRARVSACYVLTSATVFPTVSWPPRPVTMDAPEPDQTPFASVSAQTSKLQRQYQALLDQSTPYVTYRWIGTAVLLLLFFARILVAQGWYIGPSNPSPLALPSVWRFSY